MEEDLAIDQDLLAKYRAFSPEKRNEKLIKAASDEDTDLRKARALLAAGADINATGKEYGRTALHKAVTENNVGLFDLLLRHKARADIPDEEGFTALMLAAKHDYATLAERLIDHGAPIHAANRVGRTTLHLAASAFLGSGRVIEALLARNASIDAVDRNERTALHLAAEAGQLETAECLIRHGASINATDRHGSTPLHAAASSGSYEVVALLIRHGAYVKAIDAGGKSVLHVARRHHRIIDLLLQHGAPIDAVDSKGMTALQEMISSRKRGLVKSLLAKGATYDVEALRELLYSPSLLPHIVEWPSINGVLTRNVLLKALIAQIKGSTATVPTLRAQSVAKMCESIVDGSKVDEESVEALITYFPSLPSDQRNVMLYCLAFCNGNRWAIASDRPNAPQSDPAFDTPLCRALKALSLWTDFLEAEESLRMLKDKPAASTPLTFAAKHGRTSLVELLVDLGANINLPDLTGQTPLHLAARHGRLAVAQKLLDRGARKNPVDLDDRTPREWAERVRYRAIADLLQ